MSTYDIAVADRSAPMASASISGAGTRVIAPVSLPFMTACET